MDIEDIKRKLLAAGASKEDIPGIINDVNEIITAQLAKRVMKELPEEVQNDPPSTLAEWEKVISSLDQPPLSQKDIRDAVESTWQDYLEKVVG